MDDLQFVAVADLRFTIGRTRDDLEVALDRHLAPVDAQRIQKPFERDTRRHRTGLAIDDDVHVLHPGRKPVKLTSRVW